jgi:hypothetical protein
LSNLCSASERHRGETASRDFECRHVASLIEPGEENMVEHFSVRGPDLDFKRALDDMVGGEQNAGFGDDHARRPRPSVR